MLIFNFVKRVHILNHSVKKSSLEQLLTKSVGLNTHLTDCHFWTSNSWITRMCQYPRPEKLMAQPGIKPGSPTYMANALFEQICS